MAQNNAGGHTTLDVGGDLSGLVTNATVIKLQNNNVKSGTPDDGYVLTWVTANNRWEAKPTSINNVTTINNQTNYTILPTDQIIVIDSSISVPTGEILFPTSSVTGRVIAFVNVNFSRTFKVRPGVGSEIFIGYYNGFLWDYYSLTNINHAEATRGGIFTCYDGINWIGMGYTTKTWQPVIG